MSSPPPTGNGPARAPDASARGLSLDVLKVVMTSTQPLSRDDVARQLDIPRSTAGFHLEKLAKRGLVTHEAVPEQNAHTAPVGRPPKRYRSAIPEYSVSVPPRRYELAGEILTRALMTAQHSTRDPIAALDYEAEQRGRELGRGSDDLLALVADTGYEPITDDNGSIVLSNCPFRHLASLNRDLICGANLALVRGMAISCGVTPDRVAGSPHDVWCCVRVDAPATP